MYIKRERERGNNMTNKTSRFDWMPNDIRKGKI